MQVISSQDRFIGNGELPKKNLDEIKYILETEDGLSEKDVAKIKSLLGIEHIQHDYYKNKLTQVLVMLNYMFSPSPD